tara:strand:+ start:1757 stop:1933 length:177 start_codon:yes stop_codon:yes gene_type:complete
VEVGMVGMAGFEPAASRLSAGCSSQAKLHALEQTSEKHTHFEYAHLALFLVECQSEKS